jgi:DNA-binding response OmpR family regulator
MEKKTVLIVEDNPDWREIITIVERAGYDVMTAETGVEAVEKALADQPNLIFMDIGALKILQKPFEVREVERVLSQYLCTEADESCGVITHNVTALTRLEELPRAQLRQ